MPKAITTKVAHTVKGTLPEPICINPSPNSNRAVNNVAIIETIKGLVNPNL